MKTTAAPKYVAGGAAVPVPWAGMTVTPRTGGADAVSNPTAAASDFLAGGARGACVVPRVRRSGVAYLARPA